jgi:hypothetical protein
MRRNKTKEYAKMKVIKRGLFLMVALGLEVGALGPALAAAPNPLPVNGTYSFSMVGANVNALSDVPTTAATGVFKVTDVGSTSFTVANGELMLNDDRNVCIANFSGTGTPAAAGITSGTMALTLSGLSGPNCDSLSPGGVGTPTVLTLYYSVSSIGGALGGISPSRSILFIEDLDTNTISVVGEAQKQ